MDSGDISRPLADRGRLQSESFGAELARVAGPFDIAFVSAAVRTRQTYSLLAGTAPEYPSPRISNWLYDATPRSLLKMLRGIEESATRILVVGHEPVMSTLAHMLHDEWDTVSNTLAVGIPTATAVILDVPRPWAELDRQGAHVRAILRPDH